MDLPKLSRLRHPQVIKNENQEIWQPSWRCFCCHDSGLVRRPDLVISNYSQTEDLPVICQRPGCNASAHLRGLGLDERFTGAICAELDRLAREDWDTTVKTQYRKVLDLKALAKKMAMPGTRDRTENDNREVQQRKAEIEAISHEKWMAMSNEYLGGHADEYCNEK